jgi:hypothetical protein
MGLFDFFRKRKENIPAELLGTWKMMRSEPPQTEDVRMIFHPDGRLVYEIHLQDRIQMMNLTYRISENVIISDQPSHPKEEQTRFAFEDNGSTLVLEFANSKAWLKQRTPK